MWTRNLDLQTKSSKDKPLKLTRAEYEEMLAMLDESTDGSLATLDTMVRRLEEKVRVDDRVAL